MIKTVLFDLDGTLLNTIDDLADAGNWVCAQHGWPTFTVEQFKHMVGNGIPKLVERFSPENARTPEQLAATLAEFTARYDAHKEDKTAPYPGIPELLRALRARGIRTGVVSNKPHEFVTRIIDDYFPGLFDSVAGQQGTLIKPDPTGVNKVITAFHLHPDQVLYVGDSGVDIKTAQNAKAVSCGVLWGFRGEAELSAAGAAALASVPEDILTYLVHRNRAEAANRALALFTVAVMVVCLAGIFYFLSQANGAGIAACVVLPLLMGFAATRMLRKNQKEQQ